MCIEDILAWGEQHHYPQLVLREQPVLVLRHGEEAWRAMAGDIEACALIRQRIERWQQLEGNHDEF